MGLRQSVFVLQERQTPVASGWTLLRNFRSTDLWFQVRRCFRGAMDRLCPTTVFQEDYADDEQRPAPPESKITINFDIQEKLDIRRRREVLTESTSLLSGTAVPDYEALEDEERERAQLDAIRRNKLRRKHRRSGSGSSSGSSGSVGLNMLTLEDNFGDPPEAMRVLLS